MPTNITRKFLKIKEIFLNLQTKKIENIQKIISSEGKTKSRLDIMTKGPSRKQIIISMNNDNKTDFIKESSAYIININRALKNIKSKVVADFIRLE